MENNFDFFKLNDSFEENEFHTNDFQSSNSSSSGFPEIRPLISLVKNPNKEIDLIQFMDDIEVLNEEAVLQTILNLILDEIEFKFDGLQENHVLKDTLIDDLKAIPKVDTKYKTNIKEGCIIDLKTPETINLKVFIFKF